MTTQASLTNPLQIFQRALLEQLANNQDIDSLVRPRNQVSFDQTSGADPRKKNTASADLPDFVVWNTGMRGNVFASSDHSAIVTTWQLVFSAGQFNSIATFQFNWAFIVAVKRFKDWAMPLQWRGLPFITDMRLGNAFSGESNAEQNRGIMGFVTVIDFEVDMQINHTDLLLEAEL